MSILSGWKSFEKYIKLPDGYQLMSERTNSRDIVFDDDKNLNEKIGSNDISKIGDGTLTGSIKNIDDNLSNVSQGVNNSNSQIENILKLISAMNTTINNIQNVQLGGITVRVVTQSQYNALGSGRPSTTLYIIKG